MRGPIARRPLLTAGLVIILWFRLPVVVAIIGTGKLMIAAGQALNGLYG